MINIVASNPFSESLKRVRRRRGYNRRFDGASPNRKNYMKTVRFGAGRPQRAWRIKAVPKLRLKMVLSSPLWLWRKLKNAYVNVMLNLGGNKYVFGGKRIPKGRRAPIAYSAAEFDNRLVLEIYKSLVASRELAAN